MKSQLTLEDENLPVPGVGLFVWLRVLFPFFFFLIFTLFHRSDLSKKVSVQRAVINNTAASERALISE